MHNLKRILRIVFLSKRTYLLLVVFALGVFLYVKILPPATISPVTEAKLHEQLEAVKRTYIINDFVSDGCSGNVSAAWATVTSNLNQLFPIFAERYHDAETIPFEEACIKHDRAYHQGEGGYVARLQADNTLRQDIMTYGLTHTTEIRQRTGLESDEEAIWLYEVVAELVYRGVRLGGAPCSGMPYAWGYGYMQGNCEYEPET